MKLESSPVVAPGEGIYIQSGERGQGGVATTCSIPSSA